MTQNRLILSVHQTLLLTCEADRSLAEVQDDIFDRGQYYARAIIQLIVIAVVQR
jgi:hypothetical protein